MAKGLIDRETVPRVNKGVLLMLSIEESEMLFTIALEALEELREDGFLGPHVLEIETGCTCFDTASCSQKAVIIVNSLKELYEKTDFEWSDVDEAALAFLLEFLSERIQNECVESSFIVKNGLKEEHSTRYRLLAYKAFKSAFDSETDYVDLELSIFLSEQMFKQHSEFNSLDFWGDMLEIFYRRLGIDDRDYQIASKNPGMFDGNDYVNYVLGIDSKYIKIKIDSASTDKANTSLNLFHELVKAYSKNDRLILLSAVFLN
jgi:hypothetical protein